MASEEPKLTNTGVDVAIAVVAFLVLFALLGIYISDVISLYNQLLSWLYSHEWASVLNTLRSVLIAINILLFAWILFALWRFSKLPLISSPEEETTLRPVLPENEVRDSWEHIRGLANSSNPSDWNMAILQADALLDNVLKNLGYEGETIADRLKIADPTRLKSLEEVWSAHRLRNAIAHDPLIQHNRETLIHALRMYEHALKELGLLKEAASQNPA